MDITRLGPNAFAVVGTCEETKKSFGITVDPKGNNLKFVWAFKIDREKAHREGFDKMNVRGDITYDEHFPGCPHCGSKQFYVCSNCHSVNCYHGQKRLTCPSCGKQGEIQIVESIDLQGGGY